MSSARANRIPELKGRRELMTMQVAQQFSTSESWLPAWTREVSAKANPYGIGRLCNSKNVGDQFIGLVSLSLRGTIVPKQSQRGIRLPRPFSGARNDKSAWWCTKEAATKSWGRDLQMPVSSLVLGHEIATPRPRFIGGARNDSTDYPCPGSILHREDAGRSWAIRNTSNIHGVD
jgi:hypothetical protein